MSETTEIASDILIKALQAEDNDSLLEYTSLLFDDAVANEKITEKDVRRIQNVIYKVIKIKLDLSLMLLNIYMKDSRQIPLFTSERVTPQMFGNFDDTKDKE